MIESKYPLVIKNGEKEYYWGGGGLSLQNFSYVNILKNYLY